MITGIRIILVSFFPPELCNILLYDNNSRKADVKIVLEMVLSSRIGTSETRVKKNP